MYYLLIAITILISPAALAQNNSPLDLNAQRTIDRIQRLEKDLNILQKEFYKGNYQSATSNSKQTSPNSPDLEVRMTELEERMRDLNGQIEQSNYQIQTVTKKLDKIITDIDYRISSIEKSTQIASQASKEITPVEVVKKMEEVSLDSNTMNTNTNAYDEAFKYLRKSDYANAENSLKTFIDSAKPDNELLSNAYYWLGETFYVRENYEKAAVNFLKGYQGWQKGNKAPDNLLKLALSLDKMNKKKEACTTFNKVLTEFPEADSTIKESVTKEKARISCN